jgi:tripartite ATP-independent transporter DctM subunit
MNKMTGEEQMLEGTVKEEPQKAGLFTRWLEFTAAILLILITLVVTMQIVCRYILQELPPWSEELSRYLFIWANFVGAGVALARGSHVSIDSLVTRLPVSVRRNLESVVVVLVTTFSLFLLYKGIGTAAAMKGSYSTTMHFSMAWVFAALPAAGFIFLLYQLRTIFRRKAWAATLVSAIGIAVITAALAYIGAEVDVSRGFLVISLVCVVILLMAINTPISFAIGLSCLVYLLARGNIQLLIAPITIIGGMDSFVLLAVPLFILVGELMNTGGITTRLVDCARALVGHIRGSLGISTVLGEYVFSGISGASVADVSAMGSILIPAMKKGGYRPEQAVSIVASASAMGMLVPPCIPMVVLGNLTNLSVAALFVAGFLPAACMALPLIGLIYFQAVRENIPRERRESARQVLVAFRRALLPLLTPVIILGGILGGLVTPTEAGMIGVIYALILGVFVYREIKPRDLMPIVVNTASMSGMILILVGTASLLSWIFAAESVPRLLASFILHLSSSSAPFLLITIAVFVLFGAFLEGLPALIIFTPILFPIMANFADLNPVHYGIVMITSLGIGLFLPPMGIGFLIACSLGKVNVEKATRAYAPYFLVLLIGALFVAFAPWFTLVLPRLFHLII